MSEDQMLKCLRGHGRRTRSIKAQDDHAMIAKHQHGQTMIQILKRVEKRPWLSRSAVVTVLSGENSRRARRQRLLAAMGATDGSWVMSTESTLVDVGRQPMLHTETTAAHRKESRHSPVETR